MTLSDEEEKQRYNIILTLRKKNVDPQKIADAIGLKSPASVRVWLHEYRKKKKINVMNKKYAPKIELSTIPDPNDDRQDRGVSMGLELVDRLDELQDLLDINSRSELIRKLLIYTLDTHDIRK